MSWSGYLAVAGILAGGCAPPAKGEGEKAGEQEGLSRLRAEGTALVNAEDEAVVLRGVALGGWNFLETWIPLMAYPEHGRALLLADERGLGGEMRAALSAVGPGEGEAWRAALRLALLAEGAEEAGVDGLLLALAGFARTWDDSDRVLREVLETRFGVAERDRLLDIYQGAWFTEADVAWLAAQGFTVLRIPLGYRGLTSNAELAPLTALSFNEAALARLEDLLDWCEAHGVYAVIDLQESPGGHNDYADTGTGGTLYADPAMQALTVQLWEELSDRLVDRDIVAAYSLLAEPMSAPSVEARDAMYDQLVQAIRARGDDHLLVIHDGFRGMGTLPSPAEMGWEGVVYSTHLFEWGADSPEDYAGYLSLWESGFTATQALHQVPYYVGSFATFRDEDWAYAAAGDMRRLFEAEGWSWTLWTYKRIDDPIDAALFGEETGWGLRGRLDADAVFQRPDPQQDTLEALAAAYAAYGDLEVAPNPALLEALTAP